MILKLLLPLLFLPIELFSQNLDSIQSRIDNTKRILYQKKQDYDKEKSKYPLFIIYGEIKDREENFLQIWGSAIPANNDFSSPGTVEENNIIIVNPEKDKIIYNGYAGGKHYYLYKGFSKNAFGADVPVRYYGELPSETKSKISSLSNEVSNLEQKIESLSEDYKLLQTNIIISKAKEKLKGTDYEESIDLLLKAKNLSATNKEIDQLLFRNYIELAQNNSANKDYIASLSNINTAIQLSNLANQQYDELKKFHSQLCMQIADINYDKVNYSDAVSYYSQSLKYSKQNINSIREKYSESYLQLGNSELSKGNVEQAKNNYKNSFEINRSMLPQIKSKLESQQKSSFLLGFSSIIPGLGQMIQGDSKNALTHFGIFSGSLIGGFILKTVADNEYNNYKDATSEADATRLYDTANKKLNYSYALFGFGGAVIIYSIIDSFIKAENYNKKYEINFESYSQSPLSSYDNITISLKLYF